MSTVVAAALTLGVFAAIVWLTLWRPRELRWTDRLRAYRRRRVMFMGVLCLAVQIAVPALWRDVSWSWLIETSIGVGVVGALMVVLPMRFVDRLSRWARTGR